MGAALSRWALALGRVMHTGGAFAQREGGWRVRGTSEPQFDAVRRAFESCFRDGLAHQAQLAVYVDDRCVLDLHGGLVPAAADGGQPGAAYGPDSLQCIFSCSKVISGLAVAMLVDRGQLAYDAPVSRYWPEFGAHGKAHITVAQLLQHDAGLPWLDALLPPSLLRDAARLSAVLAAQHVKTHDRVYHAVSQGLLLNELFSRADARGRTVGAFVREEVCARLEGVHIHIGEAAAARLAHPIRRPSRAWAALNVWLPYWLCGCIEGKAKAPIFRQRVYDVSHTASVWSRAMFIVDGMDTSARFYNDILDVELPSSNGVASARSMARVGALIARGGELDGVRLLSRAALDEALGGVRTRPDLFSSLATETSWSQCGWHCFGDQSVAIAPGLVGWCGWGGSLWLFDPKRRLSVALATPSLTHDLAVEQRWARILNPLLEALCTEPPKKHVPWALAGVDPRWARLTDIELSDQASSSNHSTPPTTPRSPHEELPLLWSPAMGDDTLPEAFVARAGACTQRAAASPGSLLGAAANGGGGGGSAGGTASGHRSPGSRSPKPRPAGVLEALAATTATSGSAAAE